MVEDSVGIKSKWMEVFDSGDTSEINFYNVIVISSFLLFNFNAALVLPKIAPDSARKTPEQLWKWRNIANSLIHSILSGFGALFNLLKSPQLRYELITTYSLCSLTTLSFSLGYFIYDFIDMATHHRRRSTYELLVHHTLVIVCFTLAVTTKFYQGYALVSLIIEVNSIFLHIRQLLIIQGWNKSNIFYKINSYFNLGTFVVFRLMNLVWMIWWLARNQSDYSVHKLLVSYAGYFTSNIVSGRLQGTTFAFFSAFAMLFVLVHSLKLFKQILIADGYVSRKCVKDEYKSSGYQTSVPGT